METRYFRCYGFLVWILLSLSLSLRALAGTVSFPDCLEVAARKYGVSPLLLEAIAMVETGNNPYAVGIKAKGDGALVVEELLKEARMPYRKSRLGSYLILSVHPETEGRALWAVKVADRFADYDLGAMQINKLWVEAYGLNPKDLFNICYNYEWGAYVLARMVDRYGYTWKAVWHYNGRREYAQKVISEIRELCKGSEDSYCRNISRR